VRWEALWETGPEEVISAVGGLGGSDDAWKVTPPRWM
jgi:hypothetical protein